MRARTAFTLAVSLLAILSGACTTNPVTSGQFVASPPPPPPPPPPQPVTLTGNSDDVRPVPAALSPFTVRATYRGPGNFIVWGKRGGQNVDLLANAIGDYQGRRLGGMDDPVDTLDIRASGPWTLTVEPLASLAGSVGPFSGSSDDVVAYVGVNRRFAFTHQGDANFIVWAHTAGGHQQLLANAIGVYTGTRQIDQPGAAYLEITADGPWTATPA